MLPTPNVWLLTPSFICVSRSHRGVALIIMRAGGPRQASSRVAPNRLPIVTSLTQGAREDGHNGPSAQHPISGRVP